MTLIQALVLGIVQGLTEFLPISSSAHLVLVPHTLGWQFDSEQAFVFNILVQWGTLLAVVVYFWGDLLPIGIGMLRSLKPGVGVNPHGRLGWLLILATLPAIAAGWYFHDAVEAAFSSPRATAVFLLGTAVLLVLAEQVGSRKRGIENISAGNAVLIGVFQALSLLPGISRSGATISGGMLAHLGRPAAARFSFLMSVPVMFGAGVLALWNLTRLPQGSNFVMLVLAGFLVSALVGYLAIRGLLAYLSNHSLYPFAIYCTALALLTLFVF
ncbi:MAG: undecaprenyl-diphosphatase UppP [Chloroflexi bacterium]|nr:undecaprenyl-diphosphatase UppP [Chloroflexota bacterium]